MPLGRYFCVIAHPTLTSSPCPQVTVVIIDIVVFLPSPFSPIIESAMLFCSTIIGNAFRLICWWRCSPDAHIIAAPHLHQKHCHLLNASQRVGHIIQLMQRAVVHGNDTVNCLGICWLLILLWSIHTMPVKIVHSPCPCSYEPDGILACMYYCFCRMLCVYAALSQTMQFMPTLFCQTQNSPVMSAPPWQDRILCVPILSSMSAEHKMIYLRMILPAEQFNFLVCYYYQIPAFASSGAVLRWLSLPRSAAILAANAYHCYSLPPCQSLPHWAQERDLLSTVHLHDPQKLINCLRCPCTDCTTAFLRVSVDWPNVLSALDIALPSSLDRLDVSIQSADCNSPCRSTNKYSPYQCIVQQHICCSDSVPSSSYVNGGNDWRCLNIPSIHTVLS
jgi:hypothetical protein